MCTVATLCVISIWWIHCSELEFTRIFILYLNFMELYVHAGRPDRFAGINCQISQVSKWRHSFKTIQTCCTWVSVFTATFNITAISFGNLIIQQRAHCNIDTYYFVLCIQQSTLTTVQYNQIVKMQLVNPISARAKHLLYVLHCRKNKQHGELITNITGTISTSLLLVFNLSCLSVDFVHHLQCSTQNLLQHLISPQITIIHQTI